MRHPRLIDCPSCGEPLDYANTASHRCPSQSAPTAREDAAGIAAELREVANDLDWIAESCVSGVMTISAMTLLSFRDRLRALAARCAPPPNEG
jgi:hypothetical protein